MPFDADKILHAFQSDPRKALEQMKADIESGGRAVVERLKTDPAARNLAIGLGAGALGGVLAGRSNDKFTATVAKLGGVAAIGGLAWVGYQKYLASKGRAAAPKANDHFEPPSGSEPAAKAFLPAPDNAEGTAAHGKSIIRAMIAAVKADGKIDSDERARLFDRLGQVKLDEDEETFLFNELAQPLDVDAVAASSTSDAHSLQIFAAAVVAIEADTQVEKDFLTTLAQKLRIDPEIAQHIQETARSA